MRDYTALAQERIEERARDEFLRNLEPFPQWVAEQDAQTLAAFFGVAHRAVMLSTRDQDLWDSLWLAREQLSQFLRDYTTFRVDDCADEIVDLAAELEREETEALRDAWADAECDARAMGEA